MQFSSYEQRAVPSMVFKYRNQTEWAEISTAELFDNKNVIVFSLPGAFTRRVRRRMSRASMSCGPSSRHWGLTPSYAFR